MKPFASAFPPLVPAEFEALSTLPPADHFDIGLVGDVYVRDDILANVGATRLSDLRAAMWQPLAGSSLIIANLEAPITEQEMALEQKPYIHKTSTAALGIFDKRFVLSLANNHIMDFGVAGLADTLVALDAAGIPHAGAGLNIDQAKTPCLVKVNDVQVAVICAADPRFHPATENSPGTCPARRDLLVEAVRKVGGNSTVVVVSLHMGLEYVTVPSATQIELAQACLEAGAHIVHFHHSHCLSGAATGGHGAILFGTGNYVYKTSNKVPSTRRTAAWRARINTHSNKVVALAANPAVIDSLGLPRPLEGPVAVRELECLQVCSRNMLGGLPRQMARLKKLLSPGFIRVNAYNYAYLLRRRGPLHVLMSLGAGVKAQFGGLVRR